MNHHTADGHCSAALPLRSPVCPNHVPGRAPQRKKNRERQSCKQCQARRCACSRESPCQSCVIHGEADHCDWSNAKPLIVHGRLAGPSAFASSQPVLGADRLPQSSRPQGQTRRNSSLRELSNRADHLNDLLLRSQPQTLGELNEPGFSSGSRLSFITSAPETVPVTNYRGEDLASQLDRFTLRQPVRDCRKHEFPSLDSEAVMLSRTSVELEEYMVQDQPQTTSHVNFNTALPGDRLSPAQRGIPLSLPPRTPPTFSASSAASPPLMQGLLGLGPELKSMAEVMGGLPTDLQIKACLEQFETHSAWMHRILHRLQFWNQVYEQIAQKFAFFRFLTQHNIQAEEYCGRLHWLAVLFAICGLGLFNNMLDDSQALQLGFPREKRFQRDLALQWCRCSTSCLQIGEYDHHPTMESIQAMALLAQLPLSISNGQTLCTVLGFLGSAIELASKIGLSVDPDNDPNFENSSALAKQNRRRLIVALLCQHYQTCGVACQTAALKSPSTYKIKLPLDQFDEDFDLNTGELVKPRRAGSTQTIMTGIRCRFQVSKVWQEMGIIFADPEKPLIHERIMALDAQLIDLEKKWPTCIRTRFEPSTATFVPPFNLQADRSGLGTKTKHQFLIDRLGCFSAFANAMIRLHRGFLVAHDGVLSEDGTLHRARVLHYGRSMLALQRTSLFSLDNFPLQSFLCTSSIALADYCLTGETVSEEFDQVMKELVQLVETLEPITYSSSILRKTHGVMRHFIKKINAKNNHESDRASKRSRIDSHQTMHAHSRRNLDHNPPPLNQPSYPPSSPIQTTPMNDKSFDINSFENLPKELQHDIHDVLLAQALDLNHDKPMARAIQSRPENLFDLGPLLQRGPSLDDQNDIIFGSGDTTLNPPQIAISSQSDMRSPQDPNEESSMKDGAFVFGSNDSKRFDGLFLPTVKF